jgi:hypothetical protein
VKCNSTEKKRDTGEEWNNNNNNNNNNFPFIIPEKEKAVVKINIQVSCL